MHRTQFSDDLFRVADQFGKVRSGKVKLQIRIAPATADVRDELHAGAYVRELSHHAARRTHQLELRPATRLAGDLAPNPAQLRQPAVNGGDRDIACALAEAAAGVANGDERINHAGLVVDSNGAQALLDLAANVTRAFEVRAFGRLQRNLKLAGIILRNKREFGELSEQWQ